MVDAAIGALANLVSSADMRSVFVFRGGILMLEKILSGDIQAPSLLQVSIHGQRHPWATKGDKKGSEGEEER